MNEGSARIVVMPFSSPSDVGELLAPYRDKLKRVVRCRLDCRLQGRIDPSDVVQDACIEAARRYEQYRQDQKMPFYVWLRFLTVQQILIVHRQHLHAKMRSVKRELSFQPNCDPAPNMAVLANELSGSL